LLQYFQALYRIEFHLLCSIIILDMLDPADATRQILA
jgi:hypothetical protein